MVREGNTSAADLRSHSALLRPIGHTLRAPNHVGFYPFRDGSWVIENFRDEAATIQLDGAGQTVPARGWTYGWKR